MTWQPIETAPREVDVLVYVPNVQFPETIAMYCTPRAGHPLWLDRESERLLGQPTHWMPLPEPPEVSA